MFFKRKNRKDKSKTEKKSRGFGSKIAALFSRDGTGDLFFEEMEDLLIEADLGGTASMEVVNQLREIASSKKLSTKEEILGELRGILQHYLKNEELTAESGKLNLFLILGVNGVGKTTTIAKLAHYYQKQKVKGIVLSAGDTFRAAAIDQLKIQGERTNCRVVSQDHGADPGAVIFDTISSAEKQGDSLILADTAGRMHTKTHLVKELEKVDKVIRGKLGEGNYKKLLVIDSTTGQNGLHQAEVFHEAMGVDGIILTKYDSTAKGGLLVSISRTLDIPFFFIGKGEGLDDLVPFDPEAYLDELLLN